MAIPYTSRLRVPVRRLSPARRLPAPAARPVRVPADLSPIPA